MLEGLSVLLQTLKTQWKALVFVHKILFSPVLLSLEGHLEFQNKTMANNPMMQARLELFRRRGKI